MGLNRRDFLRVASVAPTFSVGRAAAAANDALGVRADFPITSRPGIYLNSAYITPVPTIVAEAGRAFDESKASRPISLPDMQAKADEVRRQFQIRVSPALFNTSDDVAAVLRTVDPLAPRR